MKNFSRTVILRVLVISKNILRRLEKWQIKKKVVRAVKAVPVAEAAVAVARAAAPVLAAVKVVPVLDLAVAVPVLALVAEVNNFC